MLPYKKLLLRRNAFFRQQLSMQHQSASAVTENIEPQLQAAIESHSTTLHSPIDEASSYLATNALQLLSR